MGKNRKKGAVKCTKKNRSALSVSTPVETSHEFEGLAGFQEIKSCTLLRMNKYGKVKREIWEDGKIVKKKQGSGAGGKGKPVSSEDSKKAKKKKKKRKKKNPAQESGSQDTSSNLEKETADEGDGVPVCVQELNGEQVKKGKKRKRQQSKSEEVVKKRNKYDGTVYRGTNQNGKENVDVSKWEKLFVPSPVLEALAELGFSRPTTIQELCLPAAIKGRKDIIGAAETGSGKTLAFVIPIIHGILLDKQKEVMEETPDGRDQSEEEEDMNEGDDSWTDMESEIDKDGNSEVEDTVSDVDDSKMLSDDESSSIIDHDEEEPSDNETESLKGTHCVKVIDNVEFDFLNEKENKCKPKERKKFRALIVTPTRELAIQIKSHLDAVLKYTDIKSVVVVGGVASQKQERLLGYGPDIVVGTPGRLWELIQQGNDHLSQVANIRYLVVDETDRMVERGHFQELSKLLELINKNEEAKGERQTFVFSATLTTSYDPPKRVDLQRKKMMKITPEMKIKQFAEVIGIKKDHKVYDVTRDFGTAESLTEAKINCLMVEKDYYLYYFLKHYPGRTLVFCNSIDCVRRLQNLFTLLQCQPQSLHASMQQRQRLKSLERFSSNPRAVLLATDVAARGLDIPNIEHVIHYQVPRTAETYIHRSGRTARAKKEGLSILLIEASELKKYKKLCSTLNRDKELPSFPVDASIVHQVKKIIDFARTLESTEYRQRKKRSEGDWLRKTAKEAEIFIEEKRLDQDEEREKAMSEARMKRELKYKKGVLASMLAAPLMTADFSSKYPTQTGSLVLPFYHNNPAESNDSGETSCKALSALKEESEELSNLMKKVRHKPLIMKRNKKKLKGFGKRQKKKEKAERKLMK